MPPIDTEQGVPVIPRAFLRHGSRSLRRNEGVGGGFCYWRLLRRGFSLVEVTLALGVVSFSLLAIIGLVGSGLASVRESANDSAIAAIIQHVRAELTQPDFSGLGGSPDFNLEFNKSGNLIQNASVPATVDNDPFYRVTFETSTPTIPGGAASMGDCASLVTMTVASINGAARETNRLTFLRPLGSGL